MLRTILLSKLHRGTITECDLNYNGSIKIDEDLMDRAGIHEFERVDIFDINCGARFHTYVIKGERGSGMIGVNGAAARLVEPGDKVIIMCWGMLDEAEMSTHQPIVILMDDNNKPVQ